MSTNVINTALETAAAFPEMIIEQANWSDWKDLEGYDAARNAIAHAEEALSPRAAKEAMDLSMICLVANEKEALALINERIAKRAAPRTLSPGTLRALRGQD